MYFPLVIFVSFSEDPFEFNSSKEESFVMPLRRKRKGPPLQSRPQQQSAIGEDSSIGQPEQVTCVSPTDTVTASVADTPTPVVASVSFNPTTPPCSLPSRSTPKALNKSGLDVSVGTPHAAASGSISFSSPSSFVQPQALESFYLSDPNARYVKLSHITTVTTSRQYISTEIVERTTGNIVHSEFSEVSALIHVHYTYILHVHLPPL